MPDEKTAGKLLRNNVLDPNPRADYKTKLQRSDSKIGLVFHHVVPLAKIFDCYNALASHILCNKKASQALLAFLRLFVAKDEENKILDLLPAGELEIEVRDRLRVDLTYTKWNIVEGPKPSDNPNKIDCPGRTDDLKEDVLDLFLFGVKPHVRVAQEECRKLYHAIASFNQARKGKDALSDEDFVAVQTQANLSKPVLLKVKEWIKFDPGMWEIMHTPGQPRARDPMARWRKKQRD